MLRSLVYSLLFLANTILLAHDAIPHHHHHALVCIEREHCHDDEDHSDDDTIPAEGHSHDGSQQTADCILRQYIILPSNNLRISTVPVDHIFDHGQDLYTDLAINRTLEPILLSLRDIGFQDKTLSCYTSFASTSGLRAPPLV